MGGREGGQGLTALVSVTLDTQLPGCIDCFLHLLSNETRTCM